jgi:hypothetical protein
MDVLQTVVANLAKEEVRGFKLWLNSTNASEQRKDILLLDYIRKANNYNEDYIFGKLYEGNDKNSFYKLKHRLLEDLGNYLAMTYTGKSDANNIYWYLSLQQIFTQRSQPKVAHYYLLKAEKKGLAVEHYELLDIIYSVLIKLSGELSEIDPEIYISKQKANAILLNKMRETDQVLAAMAYRLKATQNFGSRDSNLTRLLNNTIRDFAKDETCKSSSPSCVKYEKQKPFITLSFTASAPVFVCCVSVHAPASRHQAIQPLRHGWLLHESWWLIHQDESRQLCHQSGE